MSSSGPLTYVDPQPISTPSNAPSSSSRPRQPQYQSQPQFSAPYAEPYSSGPYPASTPGIALHLGPEAQIPDDPGSVVDLPLRPPLTSSPQAITQQQLPPQDIKALKTSCQFNLREFISLQRKKSRYEASSATVNVDARLRAQAGVVLGELRTLQLEVRRLAKAAENHRWRKWLVGGALASFIPLIRRLFRRNHQDEESQDSSNDTEYAFKKSNSLLSRIKDGLFGGRLASVAFFVFAVLYVFQNEVSLRVAKTVQRRIKKLCVRIEAGDQGLDDSDMKMLEGWRWRVLL